uniref:Uncharacterized protein n=1 Tax=Nelumbo nucifera TaxID=4432 RepID=A0A823A1L4_NELNU|nr:TPA_asm: hypothetical protein HUJ06_017985 [Nelumbo nucifera]
MPLLPWLIPSFGEHTERAYYKACNAAPSTIQKQQKRKEMARRDDQVIGEPVVGCPSFGRLWRWESLMLYLHLLLPALPAKGELPSDCFSLNVVVSYL